MGSIRGVSKGNRQRPWTFNRVYPAGVVLGALVTHLASELFGVGADADGEILFSRRHIYLAIAALACGIVLCTELRRLVSASQGARDLKRLVSNGLERLPWGGGWQFYALTAVLQLGIGLGSAIGEGCFFCGHDVVFAIAGALLTAAFIALAGRLIARRLPTIAAHLAAILLPQNGQTTDAKRQLLFVAASPRPIFWSLQLANRPPPPLSIHLS